MRISPPNSRNFTDLAPSWAREWKRSGHRASHREKHFSTPRPKRWLDRVMRAINSAILD
jgi:hypothetical protein